MAVSPVNLLIFRGAVSEEYNSGVSTLSCTVPVTDKHRYDSPRKLHIGV